MQLTKYKLGDLIAQRREKNKGYDLPIRGVSRDGFIKPKVEEADTSIYNVFYKNDFVFNPARMELNSIALNLELDKALCSSLYEVFYVKDENVVLPEFLNLHIKRDEFARHCDYIGLGSAREYCRFANIAEFDIKIPSIEVQREIVQADRQIKRRIRLNEQMIDKLEATAHALYHKMFVDGIDKENLPEGWSVKTLGEVCNNITDGVHNTVEDDINGDFLLLSCKNIKGGSIFIGQNERRIDFETFTKLRKRTQLTKGDILMSSVGTIGELVLLNEDPTNYEFQRSVAIIRANEEVVSPAFLFFSLKSQKDVIEQTAHGAVQRCLFISDIANLKTIYPPSPDIIRFTEATLPLLNYIHIRQCENSKLTELQSLLLAKMGNLKQ